MNNEFILKYLYDLCESGLPRLSEEEIKNVVNLVPITQIYSHWPSNDYGDDFDLYTGSDVHGSMPRYFLKHFSRDWFGGWTHEDSTDWFELSDRDYTALCNIKQERYPINLK